MLETKDQKEIKEKLSELSEKIKYLRVRRRQLRKQVSNLQENKRKLRKQVNNLNEYADLYEDLKRLRQIMSLQWKKMSTYEIK